ncbi:MAG: hypothetical protein ABSF25_19165 [Bryobacteraceae bacterium]|jgi:hypothetical protein
MTLASRKPPVRLYAAVLLAVNVVIAGSLFGVEYSAYNNSIEGTFIAIPRFMARHPGEWKWWPLWNCGTPFETAYLPFTHWMVAALALLTRLSAARSFHIVTAAIYVSSALAVFWMALELSRKPAASFVAALAYSCVSVSALLVPAIGADAGGMLNLRRLQTLVFYGESPHTAALALLPVAVVCFSRALAANGARWKILAGVAAASAALCNAFGIVILSAALLCLLLAFPGRPWWKAPATMAAIGAAVYCWISPWMSPAMIRAIQANASTTGGDFRYTTASWIALAILTAGFLLLWLALRRAKAPAYLQFFALFGYVPTGIVLAWYWCGVAILAQPTRYQIDMDLALPLALVFAGAALLDRLPRRPRTVVLAAVAAALALQTVHAAIYAHGLIRSVDPAQLGEYRVAKWMDEHLHGQRAFISGSGSFWYNDFTENPQFHGGHDQHIVNTFIPIATYAIYSDENAGAHAAEDSIFWLKAFGVGAIHVPGPESSDYYKAGFVHPFKFEGVLPLLWRDHGDSIYQVPLRSPSLAHVMPAAAIPARRPSDGLDFAPVRAYVAALDDPGYPPASFEWQGMSEARIRATVAPGQAISVQVTYERGWEAWANGRRQPVRGDAIGQLVIEPACQGDCEISLRYTGGMEAVLTRSLSIGAMLLAGVYAWLGRRRAGTSDAH